MLLILNLLLSFSVCTKCIDWLQFGFDGKRSGHNPNETTILSKAFKNKTLSLLWNISLDGASVSQPLVLTNVAMPSFVKLIDVVYIGTDSGYYFAIDASSGNILWKKYLGAYIDLQCGDLPQNSFGVTGTAYIDRYTYQSIFAVSGLGSLHRLKLTDGTTYSSNWPITNIFDSSLDHSYGAVTYYGGRIYVTTASRCDIGHYYGKVLAFDIATATLAYSFYPASGSYYGAGIWGSGGLSIDTSTNPPSMFTATGNAYPSETAGYGENIVKLSTSLVPQASWSPGMLEGDDDFGATPLVFNPSNGCRKTLTATENKYGTLYIADTSFASIQTIQIMTPQEDGNALNVI